MKTTAIIGLVTTLSLSCTGAIDQTPERSVADPSVPGGAGGMLSRPGNASAGIPAVTPPEPLKATADTGGPAAICKPSEQPPSTLRRLTRREYNNTVADLIGDTSGPANGFSPESGTTGFDTAADGAGLNEKVVANYASAAELMARAAARNLPLLVSCDNNAMDDACASRFISRFGRRVFRRPVATDEQLRYETFFATSKRLGGFATAIEDLVRAFLMAPQFVYRIELGTGPGPRPGLTKLSNYELATRLSLFLWASAPDEELLSIAEKDGLNTVAQIATQAQRLLMHEKGGRVIRDFYEQWMDLDGLDSASRGPTFTPKTAANMRQEIQTYFDLMIRQRAASWTEVLTSRTSFINDDLAKVYGLTGITGPQFREVTRQGDRHRGFLTMPGIMTLRALPNEGSPIHRGKLIREQLLCEPALTPPPDLVLPKIPPANASKTARQQLEDKTQMVPPCMSCHNLINPPGFAFEKFDQLGAWHDFDSEKRPHDTAGALAGTDIDGPFKSHIDLIERLATSKQANSCVGTLWFRYALARRETQSDDCVLRELLDTFTATKGDIKSVILKLAVSDVFIYR